MSITNQLARPLSLNKRKRLRFDLPIAQRLTLGFLAAAIIAGIVAGVIGFQRIQAIQRQSSFYKHLLTVENKLHFGSNVLEATDTQMREVLFSISKEHETPPSLETLTIDLKSLETLRKEYDIIVKAYLEEHVLSQHPDHIALLGQSNPAPLITHQTQQIQSVQRTWKQYYPVQAQILTPIKAYVDELKKNPQHNTLENWESIYLQVKKTMRVNGEHLLAEARNAMKGLQQFNDRLSESVFNGVQNEERYQLLSTIVGMLFAFIAIILVGVFISNALVYRVKQLRSITSAIEGGNVDARQRIKVIGRDEIADISSSVNAMLEIIAAEQEIMTASELKEQFIASVSHELRNPLTEVYGWLEILSMHQGQLDAATQTKCLNRALHGCQELMLLINNVLDATRVDRRTQTPRLENVPIAQVAQAVLEHLDPRETAQYRWHVELPKDLVVWADVQHVRQILRNLISNAMKYSPKKCSITLRASRYHVEEGMPSQVLFSVKDTGPGIPPGEIPQLFQKFARLERDKLNGIRGTGLGLYICKQLVETMHGQIWVESEGLSGKGSKFFFTLPEAPAGEPTDKKPVPISVPEADQRK